MGRRNHFLVVSLLVMVASLIVAVLWSGGGAEDPASPQVTSVAVTPDDDGRGSAAVEFDPADVGDERSTVDDPERAAVSASSDRAAAAGLELNGRVVDPSGAPIAGLALTWQPSARVGGPVTTRDAAAGDPGRARRVETDAQGRFAIRVEAGVESRLSLPLGERFLFDGERRRQDVPRLDADKDLGDLLVRVAARIAGRVVDRRGIPAEGVRVHVGSSPRPMTFPIGRDADDADRPDPTVATTGADGRFEFFGLTTGDHWLTTASPRYAPATQKVVVARAGDFVEIDVEVSSGQSVAGHVVDDRGAPIVGARVAAFRERDVSTEVSMTTVDANESVETDANGRFELFGITDPLVQLRAWADGHGSSQREGVTAGADDVEITLSRRAGVRGVLVDEAGEPIAGSRVTVRRERREGTGAELDVGFLRGRPIETAADGSFAVDGVRSGSVIVRAVGPTHRPTVSDPIQVRPGQVVEGVRLVARRGATLDVLVVDADGKPVEGARVEAERHVASRGNESVRVERREVRRGGSEPGEVVLDSTSRSLGSATTDAAGNARIAGLPDGRIDVAARHDDLAPSVPATVTVSSAQPVETVLTLRPGGFVSLRTVDADANPINTGYVVRGPKSMNDDEVVRRGASGAGGVARVGPLPPGRYEALLRTQPRAVSFGGAGMVSFSSFGANDELAPSRVEFTVAANETTEATLVRPIFATVSGTLRGADGPVGGAEVTIAEADQPVAFGGSYRATTAADGTWSIDDVPPGSYRLRYGRRTALVKHEDDLEIATGERSVQRDLVLSTGRVRVAVLDGEDQAPVERANVMLRRVATGAGAGGAREQRVVMLSVTMDGSGAGPSTMEMSAGGRVRTDDEGVAAIDDVPPGAYVLIVEHKRFVGFETEVTVTVNATADLGTINLAAAGFLRGRVLGGEQQGFSVSMIEVTPVDDPDDANVETAMGGSYRIESLSPGRYRVRARPAGPPGDDVQWGEPTEVEVVAGRTAVADVRLPVPNSSPLR